LRRIDFDREREVCNRAMKTSALSGRAVFRMVTVVRFRFTLWRLSIQAPFRPCGGLIAFHDEHVMDVAGSLASA